MKDLSEIFGFHCWVCRLRICNVYVYLLIFQTIANFVRDFVEKQTALSLKLHDEH